MRDSAKFAPTVGGGPGEGTASRVRPPDPLIGYIVDERYKVEALLGEGGMGLVYQVRHTKLERTMAMKVLRPEASNDDEVLQRFRQEAQSASAIGNQHIVDISDFGMLKDGSTYFIMELLDGIDLIQAIDAAQHFAEPRSIHIAKQLCRALGAAHEVGIVHRDLKPENVFLITRGDDPDFVKVLDFGIAKVGESPSRLTRTGEVFGTPHYMSPEQCEGTVVDRRTDIYALGVMIYEMLTGHVPHDADTMMGILTKHIYHEPVPPRVRVPDVSEPLEEAVMRCLEKLPEKRYQTMDELHADLERIEAGAAPEGPAIVSIRPTRPPESRTLRRYLALVGILGFGVLAFLLFEVFRTDETVEAVQPTAPLPVVAEPAEVPPEPTKAQEAPTKTETAKAAPTKTETAAVSAEDDRPRKTSKRRKRVRPVRAKPPKTESPKAKPANDGALINPWE